LDGPKDWTSFEAPMASPAQAAEGSGTET
jgi:hypothetical protein